MHGTALSRYFKRRGNSYFNGDGDARGLAQGHLCKLLLAVNVSFRIAHKEITKKGALLCWGGKKNSTVTSDSSLVVFIQRSPGEMGTNKGSAR